MMRNKLIEGDDGGNLRLRMRPRLGEIHLIKAKG